MKSLAKTRKFVKEKILDEGEAIIAAQSRLEAKKQARGKALGQEAAIRPAGELAREAAAEIRRRVIYLAVDAGDGKPLVWRTAADAVAEGVIFSSEGGPIEAIWIDTDGKQ